MHTKRLLHAEVFTPRSLCTKASLTQRSLYTEQLLHGSFSIPGDLFKGSLIKVFLLNYLNLSFFTQGILKLMESGQKNMRKSMFVFCVVGCGTRSLSRRVPCPLLKIVALPRAKNRALDRAVCHPPAFVLKSWSRSCSLLQLVSSTLKDIYIYIRRLFKYKMNEEF